MINDNIYSMEINYTESHNQLRISLCGELDENNANDIRTSMDNTISSKNFCRVIFDMSKLSFMDSTGIGILVGRYKKFSSTHFYIDIPSPQIDKLLKLSGIYTIMPRLTTY